MRGSTGRDTGTEGGNAPREPERLRSWPPTRAHHRLTPEAAATVATSLDAARAQAAAEGRTLVYTVRFL